MNTSGIKQPEMEILLSALDLKPLCTFSQGSFHVLNENTCKVLAIVCLGMTKCHESC